MEFSLEFRSIGNCSLLFGFTEFSFEFRSIGDCSLCDGVIEIGPLRQQDTVIPLLVWAAPESNMPHC